MSRLPDSVQRYLDKRGAGPPWTLAGNQATGLRGAIVIPSLAEGASLLATLHSLTANPAEQLSRFLVIVVVNHRTDSAAALRECNLRDLLNLADFAHSSDLRLAWVDAASAGCELPARGGVGLVRKIGLDLALSRLAWSKDPLLVFLDADTLVEANYLEAIETHFAATAAGAAALAFHHQPAPDPAHQAAIDRYELFVRCYPLGLARAGSPYAFTTVGSAIACRAATYVRCGGMNRRVAGEDFYFLQQAAKTDGVATLYGTCVHPSARLSRRTPFGTGMSVAQQLSEDAAPLLFYPADAFKVLASWLTTVTRDTRQEASALLARAAAISPPLAEFLDQAGLTSVWPGIQRNHAGYPERLRAFHGWFDGLKTLRLIHRLCDTTCPRQAAEQAVPELLAWCGAPAAGTPSSLLTRVRNLQETPPAC